MSDSTVIIDRVKYDKSKTNDAIGFGLSICGVILAAATIWLFIAVWVNWSAGNNEMRDWRRDHHSHQFFTAVQESDPSIIENDDLRRFYKDISEVESIAPESDNALIPSDLSEINFHSGMYGDMCDYFFTFAVPSRSGGCSTNGVLTQEFLNQYDLARAGESPIVDSTPRIKPDVGFPGIFGLSPLMWWGAAWIVANLIILVGSIVGGLNEKVDYYYRDREGCNEICPWFTWKSNWWAYMLIPGIIPKATRIELKVARHLNGIKERLSKKKFAVEIADLKEKIRRFEELPSEYVDASVKKSLNEMRAVLADLESYETALEKRSIKYLAQEYTNWAKEVRQSVDANLDSIDIVNKL